jgi:hypothetical protein
VYLLSSNPSQRRQLSVKGASCSFVPPPDMLYLIETALYGQPLMVPA